MFDKSLRIHVIKDVCKKNRIRNQKKKKKKVTKGRNNHEGQSDPQKAKAKQKKVLKVFEFSFI